MDTTLDSDRKHFDFVGFFIDFSLYRIVHEAVCGTDLQNQDSEKTKAANFGRSAPGKKSLVANLPEVISSNLIGKNYTVFSRRSRSHASRDYFVLLIPAFGFCCFT